MGKTHKTDLEGKENPVLRYLHWHKDSGKALQGEIPPWKFRPEVVGCASPGSTTAQLCPCEQPQSSTSFCLAALSPVKPKGSEAPPRAVLLISDPK